MKEGDGGGVAVLAGRGADPFDLLGLEPGVTELAGVGGVGRVGVGIHKEQIGGGDAVAVDRDFEVGEGALGVECVDGMLAGGDDSGEFGEGAAVFVVMVTVDDGPWARVGIEAVHNHLHQGVGRGGVDEVARDGDEVRVGPADEAVHARENVRDLVWVEELEVEVSELQDLETAVGAEVEFRGGGRTGVRGAKNNKRGEGFCYDADGFHNAKLTKS